ncbi:MAG: glycosyltransferase family 4 protein [Caldisphaera sp.]
MKIDYICIGYHPIIGGTENLVKNLAEKMAQKGHDVTVHTSMYNPNHLGRLSVYEIINGVKVRRYSLFPFYLFFPKIIEPQIIHLFSYGDNFILQSFLHASKCLVSSPIGEEIYAKHKIRNKFLGKHALRISKIVFAMTSFEKNALNKFYGIPLDKIFILPGGVSQESFSSPNLNNVRKDFLGFNKKKYFTRLARVDRVKNLEFGIQLLKYFSDLEYVVIGPKDDIIYLKELLELGKKLGVDDRIIFTGKVNEDEKRYLLHNSFFYLIANFETFGISTLEAMAQNVPIIAPNIEEYKDILIDHVNSLIYEYNSIESCIKTVKLMSEDNLLRLRLGENGKNLVKDKFVWDHIANVLERVYKDIC